MDDEFKDKDKFFLDDEHKEDEVESVEPIDGQIGIEELYVRNYEDEEPSPIEDPGPIDNQISFDEILRGEQEEITNFLQEQKDRLETKEENDRSKLDDFFKSNLQIEKEKLEREERQELNNFFDDDSKVQETEKISLNSKNVDYNNLYNDEEPLNYEEDEGLIVKNIDETDDEIDDEEMADFYRNDKSGQNNGEIDGYGFEEERNLGKTYDEIVSEDNEMDDENEEIENNNEVDDETDAEIENADDDEIDDEYFDEEDDDEIEDKGNKEMSKKKKKSKKKNHMANNNKQKNNKVVKTPNKVVANKATNFVDDIREERIESLGDNKTNLDETFDNGVNENEMENNEEILNSSNDTFLNENEMGEGEKLPNELENEAGDNKEVESANVTGEESLEDETQETTEESIEESAEENSKESAEEDIEDGSEESGDVTNEESLEDGTQEGTEESVDVSNEDSIKESTEESAGEVLDEKLENRKTETKNESKDLDVKEELKETLKEEKETKAKERKSTLKEKEEFFLNDDNSAMVNEVDKINSEITDVDVKVGKDAFGDYVSNELKTEKVDEEEVKAVKEKVVSENSGEDVVDGMLYKNLDTVLHESMIPYSEHVILDRAIPRVEDGLKPVQRRILYSMIELGVTPDKPFRKSARIVGDCLGKYHPHGDSSVYDAMVRLAQPFNTNMLLVEGHGNFGSVDGDGAAAMRYTEARLAPIALELLRDLDKNTVRWGLNFDDTLKEPEILPGRFPNLLVNGSTGIAVGLATNIPPHNLAETIDGVVAYIDNPNITLKEMMRIIKGPDFPTGGYILNSSEIKEAYGTGRGKIYIRAKMHIETNNSDKKYIVITELPYQVNKSSLLQKINSFKEEDKYGLGVISEVRDESDRDGLRAVIRLKKDANVKKVYEALIKYTELQVTFGVNMVAIANGKPKQMGLLDIISYYTEYQREIILRRSKFECEQAKEREHILSGLLIAIKNIDAVVKIIKTSKNTTEAKIRLREKFYLSEKQAQAILDMRLARLTSLEVYKLEEEIKKLRELIKRLTEIINSKKEQLKVVRDEILQIKREHKKERKTKILKTDDTLNIAEQPEQEKEAPSQKMVILKNAKNNFKCLTQKQFNMASKDFTDSSTLFEAHSINFETETGKQILAFSSLGNCFKVNLKDFGESRYKDKGINERMIFKELTANETIVALVDYDDTKTKDNLLFLTKFGMIKKTPVSEYALLKKYFQAMKLKEGDEILTIVKEPQNEYNYLFVTSSGMVLKAENKDVPVQGRVSGGVKGMAFTGNDFCVCSKITNDEGEVVLVTDKGNAKRVVLTNIDKMVRYRKGLKIMVLSGETGKRVVFADVVKQPFTVVAISENEEIYSKSTDLIPIETRIGKGKVLEKSKKNMQIKQVVVALWIWNLDLNNC